MRLNQHQVESLTSVFDPYAQKGSQLHLYGSQVRDDLRDGDIDLLFIASDNHLAKSLKEKKHHILAAIKGKIGDQKIDLKITSFQEINEDEFLSAILDEAILLHTW